VAVLTKVSDHLVIDLSGVQAVHLQKATRQDGKNLYAIQFLVKDNSSPIGTEVYESYHKVSEVWERVLKALEVVPLESGSLKEEAQLVDSRS